RSRRISRTAELPELFIRANSITGFGVDVIYLSFLPSAGRPFSYLTEVAVSHLEKFDGVIHATIELAAIGCAAQGQRVLQSRDSL
ncbi:MAG: hypothetical protein KGJ19_08950, partial [Betaproteobacteria bacterium]|nr:hypothetical protein [Betaproteobacteria bacterium]